MQIPSTSDGWNHEWDDACQESGIARVMACTQTMIHRGPNVGAGYLRVAEGIALFQGNDAIMTRASGLGWQREATTADVDLVESFFRERDCAVVSSVGLFPSP